MDPYKIITRFYDKNSLTYQFLLPHSEAVAEFALRIGRTRPGINLDFIREAALLHDIGIFMTKAPGIGCTGTAPYIQHGVLGEQLLQDLGYPEHARVCRTHVGVSLSADYILQNRLPLPAIDMIPESEEEIIVAYADKFFSKQKKWLTTPKPYTHVLEKMEKFGNEPVKIFKEWHKRYDTI